MFKRLILFLLLSILIFGYVSVIAIAQEDGDKYVVNKSLKVYAKPKKFSKTQSIGAGTIIKVDPNFQNETFKKISSEDANIDEGYILAEELFGNNLSAVTSDGSSQGEGSTASARGSRGDTGGLSLAKMNLKELGNSTEVNKMEKKSQIIDEEKWEHFRKIGNLGEFFAMATK